MTNRKIDTVHKAKCKVDNILHSGLTYSQKLEALTTESRKAFENGKFDNTGLYVRIGDVFWYTYNELIIKNGRRTV